MFKSDFGIVAEYFVSKRKGVTDNYSGSEQEFTHVQETLQLLNVMTKDNRFEQVINDTAKGVPKNMCEILDMVENRGMAKGKAEGVAEGMAKGEAKGRAEGEAKGMNNLALLMSKLFQLGRTADAEKAANDSVYRDKLLKEFGISD